ncbi:MAG TPA: hypothetical protein VGK34_03095 [Armatimonadota bacterium]
MVKKHKILALVSAAVFMTGVMASGIPARAGIDLGGILKGAAAVVLTDQFAGQINDFINKFTMNKGYAVEDRTKVVPIISLGQGFRAGAAQVSGPGTQIDKVKAVAQIETKFSGVRINILVPVASKSIGKDIKRVSGVGVSAIIDLKL